MPEPKMCICFWFNNGFFNSKFIYLRFIYCVMDTEKYLLKLGFKRKWLSDKSGYWLEKKLKNKYFKNLIISYDISMKLISVWCRQIDEENYNHSIIETKHSKKKVKELLIMFDENYLFK